MKQANPPAHNPQPTAALLKLGLTASQANGYLALVEHGSLSPVELAAHTSESRTNGYQICDKLEALGLARKLPGARATYAPESPVRLRQLLLSQQQSLKQATSELNSLLPNLLRNYRLATDKPGVVYLEGTDSLQTIYEDIIKTGATLRIMPSKHGRDDPAIAQMIDSQVARQRAAGIKTEALLPSVRYHHYQGKNDALFEARPSLFAGLDAQIMIYGPNVAISTYSDTIITTVITNPVIAATFNQLFDCQWQLAAGKTCTGVKQAK